MALLSVIVPCFNEQDVVQHTYLRLRSVLEGIPDCDAEIVFVDDGSVDGTLEILNKLQENDSSVRVVALSRNFGHQIALTAGLDFSQGNIVAVIDADLQDPPELIVDMVEKWREGYDVIFGQRTAREGETRFKLATAHIFYRLLNVVSDVEIPRDTGDFRLMDEQVVVALRRMPERDRFVRGMVSWVGFRQYALPYERSARFAGETKYPLRKMIRFALNGILAFSIQPLRAATWIGFSTAGLAIVGILYAVLMRLFTDAWVSGWTLLFIGMLFIGGVQLLVLGVVGEYIGRLYEQSKLRPLYLAKDVRGFDTPDVPQNAQRLESNDRSPGK